MPVLDRLVRDDEMMTSAPAEREMCPTLGDEIASVIVVGAGTMGSGITQVVAEAGVPVTLFDSAPADRYGGVGEDRGRVVPGSRQRPALGGGGGVISSLADHR